MLYTYALKTIHTDMNKALPLLCIAERVGGFASVDRYAGSTPTLLDASSEDSAKGSLSSLMGETRDDWFNVGHVELGGYRI